ncbi:MAG: hypothetical protein GTN62_02740 [Gemmatimonadales bacterium]|nr:hypothetical protein [Gemmatimonadales bacterium]NIN10688.1 hypothetical protein [Gemmatimonadales bacterium]NIN49016.1 hypothetical protein [Gemmatimonadales bacterium]NIP06480.1 hypothetical protein [Gemmatimonadales bacterium]NIQ98825.1 hypothetical protein [Gemmatimonadales bacterium]
MSTRIEYNGYVIEPTTKLQDNPHGWTLEVRITPAGRSTGVRRCRAPNTYPNEEVAVARCLAFGRRIVDGKAQRKVDPTK